MQRVREVIEGHTRWATRAAKCSMINKKKMEESGCTASFVLTCISCVSDLDIKHNGRDGRQNLLNKLRFSLFKRQSRRILEGDWC
jgi:hypothetical protein